MQALRMFKACRSATSFRTTVPKVPEIQMQTVREITGAWEVKSQCFLFINHYFHVFWQIIKTNCQPLMLQSNAVLHLRKKIKIGIITLKGWYLMSRKQ